MPALKLKRILKRGAAPVALEEMSKILKAPFCVEDASGDLLYGEAPAAAAEKFEVTLGEETLGFVMGSAEAAGVARLLSKLAAAEAEKKALAAETLERYKEINLLYSVAERLGACLDAEAIAHEVLSEVQSAVPADSASVMLVDAGAGDVSEPSKQYTCVEGLTLIRPCRYCPTREGIFIGRAIIDMNQ